MKSGVRGWALGIRRKRTSGQAERPTRGLLYYRRADKRTSRIIDSFKRRRRDIILEKRGSITNKNPVGVTLFYLVNWEVGVRRIFLGFNASYATTFFFVFLDRSFLLSFFAFSSFINFLKSRSSSSVQGLDCTVKSRSFGSLISPILL